MLPSPSSTVTVLIDGYTHNSTLTSGDSVPLGTQIILVCRVVGLPYGTPLSYTWTCRNGYHCELEDSYANKIYNDHTLAINATVTFDKGTFTCYVKATGGQEATGSFTLTVTGMCVCLVLYYSSNGTGTSLVLHTHSGGRVVHSNGRLIPHQYLITSKHNISTITSSAHSRHSRYIMYCVSSGRPTNFYSPNGTLNTGGVTQSGNMHISVLEVNAAKIDTFQNRDVYCDDNDTNYFYLYFTSSNNSE